MLSLAPTDDQLALEESITGTSDRLGIGAGPLSSTHWRALAELGVLGLGTELVGGDTIDLVHAMRAIGRLGCLGPFGGAVLALRVLDDPALIDRVLDGTVTISVSDGSMAPGALEAAAVVEVGTNSEVALVEILEADHFQSLAGLSWYRVRTAGTSTLGWHPVPVGVVFLARAAWMIGAADALLELAASHARDRRQFGRPIGDFQAVAHPLASAAAEIGAAYDAVVLAAGAIDRGVSPGQAEGACRAATRASLAAAFASHQAHGAIGFTVERGLHQFSCAIREYPLHPPVLPGRSEPRERKVR